MGIGATASDIPGSYSRIKTTQMRLWDIADKAINRIDAGVVWSYLVLQTLPDLKNSLEGLPDSSAYPQAWIDALAAHASSQTLTPVPDYPAAYESVRSNIKLCIDELIAAIPKDENGKALIITVGADSINYEVATGLASLRVALEALKTSIE